MGQINKANSTLLDREGKKFLMKGKTNIKGGGKIDDNTNVLKAI